MLDAALDLFLGAHCVVCGRPPRGVCSTCRQASGTPAEAVRPQPCPPGLLPTWSVGSYEAGLQQMILAHKERGVWHLARALGALLAVSVGAAVVDLPVASVALVAVPSRPSAVRQRGYDPTGAMVAACAAHLRRQGVAATRRDLLRAQPGLRDQAGLDVHERRANLDRAMWCPSALLSRWARTGHAEWVVLCDDVVTTGWTLREAQRALQAVGVVPVAAASVAVTRRRGTGRTSGSVAARGRDQGPGVPGCSTSSPGHSPVPLPGVGKKG